MEIIQERLDREFNMDVITTVPNVSYMVYDKQGNAKKYITLLDYQTQPWLIILKNHIYVLASLQKQISLDDYEIMPRQTRWID